MSLNKKQHFAEIANPCIDGVFKYAFADPEILKDFLNTMLKLEGDNIIGSLDYLDPGLPKDNPLKESAYDFTVDVRCRTLGGLHFLIEMQNDFREDYHLKALVQHCRMISRLDSISGEAKEGTPEDDDSFSLKGRQRHFWRGIKGIYTIVLTNKVFPRSLGKPLWPHEALMEPDLINPYELRHKHHVERHYGLVPHEIILIMVANLPPEKVCTTPQESWSEIFKLPELETGTAKLPKTKTLNLDLFKRNATKGVLKMVQRLSVDKLPPHVLEMCQHAVDDYNISMDDIREKMFKKGLEEGQREGELQKAREIAQKLLDLGLNAEVVAEATKLSLEEIKALPTQH